MAGAIHPGGFGRRVPQNWDHVDNNRLRLGVAPPVEVEVILDARLDKWSWADANQGATSACTGFAATRLATMLSPGDAPYDPWRQWDLNKANDEWSDTNPGDNNGSSASAACWVLQNIGPTIKATGEASLPDGIGGYSFTLSTSAIRTCIYHKIPILTGTNWYNTMSDIVIRNGERWCGLGGFDDDPEGHSYILGGWSDLRNAVLIFHSWGIKPVWLPVPALSRLIRENGEFAVVTSRIPIIVPPPPDPDPPPIVVTPVPPDPAAPTRTPPAGAVSVTPKTIFNTESDLLILEDGQYRPFHVTNPGTVLFARNIGGAVVVGGKEFEGEDAAGIRVSDGCDGFQIDGVALRGSPGRGLRVTACENVVIRNVESFEHQIEGAILGNCKGALIEDLYVHDNDGDDRSHGLYVSGDCSGTVIRRLRAEKVTGSGLQINSASLGFKATGIEVDGATLEQCGVDGTPALSMMGISRSRFSDVAIVESNAGITMFADGQGAEFACHDNEFERCSYDGSGKWAVHEEEGSEGNTFADCEGLP